MRDNRFFVWPSAFGLQRRWIFGVHKCSQESQNSPGRNDEEQAHVAKFLLDLLAKSRNHQIVDDVGRKKERIDRPAVPKIE